MGTVEDCYPFTYSDGVTEGTFVVRIAGQVFDVPLNCLTDAAYDDPKVGDTIRVEWPQGRIPRTMGLILPPLEKIEGV